MMTIGVYTFEMHLPLARSLKNKRQVVKRLKDRLRARYNVAVAEMEQHADLWQRAGLAVVSVAANRDILVRLFEKIRSEAEGQIPGQLVDEYSDFIDAAEADQRGWGEEWS